MAVITAHCLVKNEENFIWYAIKSVIEYVDNIIVFDTGSTDKTVEIVKDLAKEYLGKIIFEEKGPCDAKRHTELRQEMLEKTNTDWFMILDGDEIWTKRGMEEACKIIDAGKSEIIESYFYECVGDIYHSHRAPGYETVRFGKCNGLKWSGSYGIDTLVSTSTEEIFSKIRKIEWLKNKFWHATHLARSSQDEFDYSSGGDRAHKRRLTYFLIGKKIHESIPEVFESKNDLRMSWLDSFINFFKFLIKRQNIV